MLLHEAVLLLKGMQRAYDLERETNKAEIIENVLDIVQNIEVVNPM